jgi:hypothetical protein
LEIRPVQSVSPDPNHIAWSFYGGETYIRFQTIPERICARLLGKELRSSTNSF